MFKRTAVYTLGLAAATGGPIAYFAAPDYWKSTAEKWLPAGEATASENPGENGSSDAAASPGSPSDTAKHGVLEGPSVEDLGQILNLDVTPGWITSHWPRVTTGLSYLQLQGYRVPLVTGTKESDLAGALTYYFNPQQKVQRITFQGTAGKVDELIALLQTRYQFTRRVVNDPGLFIYETASPDGHLSGVLKIRSAAVVKSSDPFRRFRVELIVERPS